MNLITTAFYELYSIMVGNIGLLTETSFKKRFFVVVTLFEVIVMLNLLVSVISDSYDKVQT